MTRRKSPRRFERLESRVLPAFSTQLLALLGTNDANPGPFTGPVNVNGTLFFAADNGVNGTELWKSNGTAAGTMMLKDVNPGLGSSSPNFLTNVNGTLFFTAR